MQDIIPPRKSIRDIPLPEGRQSRAAEIERSIRKPREEPPIEPAYDGIDDIPPPRRDTGEKGPRKILWTIAIALILGVVLSVFFLYSKATIAIVTKNQTIPVDLTATSTKDGTSGTLPYSIVTLEKDESVALNGTISSSTQVEKKASGTITVYNNYSAASQDLIATTRFQTPDGLVYRIDKSITVPGQTTQNGQTVPGSIDVVVYADQAGPKYNIGLTNFTVPGFQGTAKATAFYAKSKTAMTGGYVGNATTVSDSELSSKTADLQSKIHDELVTEVGTETPDTFVFFPSGMAVDFTTSTDVENGQTMLKGKGVALAPIFNKKFLTDAINQANGTNYSVFDDWENLQADIANTKGLTAGDFPDLSLHLTGNVDLGQDINIGDLQRTLAGRPKNDLSTILSAYPSVLTANATIRPFWKTHFPDDAKKINITLTKQQ